MGGSRNFNTRERGPGAVEFLGSADCFDTPSSIPYVFVVRVGHLIYIIYNCKHWMLTIQFKYMHIMQSKSKFTKTNFSNGVALARCAGVTVLIVTQYQLLLVLINF